MLSAQLALARLEGQLRALDQDDNLFAKAHHLYATLQAYEQVLLEACRLAGVRLPRIRDAEVRRMLAEVELRSRGWTW